MNLNNASIPRKSLRGETRYLTNTNTTTYPNIDLDASINQYLDLFTTEILDSMDEWDYQGETATADLVASQQEYIFPSDILKIKRIEISYDGTNWYKAEPMDINERGEATDTTSIASDFTTSEPFFDLMDNSVMLYPIPSANVTGGIKIWYEKLQTALSADTDEPNFAKPFHKGLCYASAKDYFEKYLDTKGNLAKMQNAENKMETYIQRMKTFYRKKNQDRAYNVDVAFVDYDFGNDY